MRIVILAALAGFVLAAATVFADERAPRAADDGTARDCPLYEAPNYTDGSCIMVRFTVLDRCRSMTYLFTDVSLERLDVQLRTDGEKYTSLCCHNISVTGSSADRATILVPMAEDVAVWQAELDRWRSIRRRYVDELPKPKRVLPRKP